MDAPIACTLSAAEVPGRLDAWRDVLTHVVERTHVDGGLRLTLDPTTPVDEVARLAAAEHGCCSFFAFAITIDGRGQALEVTAPPDGVELVTALFG